LAVDLFFFITLLLSTVSSTALYVAEKYPYPVFRAHSDSSRTIPPLNEWKYQELRLLDSGLFRRHPSWSDRLLPTPRGCLAV